MKMISFCNKKGGIGKTTICKNIACKLALENKNVLVIDLDPQAYLTTELIKKQEINNLTLIDFLETKNNDETITIDKIIKKSKYHNIDLLPGSKSLLKSSLTLRTLYQESELYLIIYIMYLNNQNVLDQYDYILIDYPPSLNELNFNFLILSDIIIIPINDSIAALMAIKDLKKDINLICKKEKIKIPIIKILLNNVKNNTNMIRIKNWLKQTNLDSYLLKTIIKQSDVYKTTENDGQNIWKYKYYWKQKQIYNQLIKEILAFCL